MASSLHSPTILPRGASLFLALFHITALLLQYHILPVAGFPVPAENPYSLLSPANNPVTMPIISKRGAFDSTTGATIGGAIIVVVGVVIGLGCALIAVCGFPWKAMCARRSRVQDLDKGKEKSAHHAVDTTPPALPPPPATPSPHPNMPPTDTTTPPGGQYYRGRTPPPDALRLWNRRAVPGYPRPQMYGREVDDASVEQQFHQHEAQPRGYI